MDSNEVRGTSTTRIDLVEILDTPNTINFTTMSGSEFQVRHHPAQGPSHPAQGLSLGWFQVERMGLTGVEFVPFATLPERSGVEIVVGEQVAGFDIHGRRWSTSHVTEIAIFQGAAA